MYHNHYKHLRGEADHESPGLNVLGRMVSMLVARNANHSLKLRKKIYRTNSYVKL